MIFGFSESVYATSLNSLALNLKRSTQKVGVVSGDGEMRSFSTTHVGAPA
jgi:hypothetical protein